MASAPQSFRGATAIERTSDKIYGHSISLVIDMGGGASTFALLVEYAASRGVPVLRAQSGPGSAAGGSRRDPGRIAFLTYVLRAVRDHDFRLALRKSWSDHRDDERCLKLLGNKLEENSKWMINAEPGLRQRRTL
jgi:hypothetical protein